MEASVVSPARFGSLRAAVRGLWDNARGYQRLAHLVGAGLIAIGLAHAGIWAVTGGSASGALSWRKPTTFGISFWRPHSWLRPRSPAVAVHHRHPPSPKA